MVEYILNIWWNVMKNNAYSDKFFDPGHTKLVQSNNKLVTVNVENWLRNWNLVWSINYNILDFSNPEITIKTNTF